MLCCKFGSAISESFTGRVVIESKPALIKQLNENFSPNGLYLYITIYSFPGEMLISY